MTMIIPSATTQPAPSLARPAGLYLHIPFCRTKCHYCDFNTYAGLEDLIPAYVNALNREMEEGAIQTERAGRQLVSLFFGGGTPSLLEAHQVARLIETASRAWGLPATAEVTLEANPETVTLASLRDLRAAGINRLSFGVQSLQPRGLLALGRTHGVDEVVEGLAAARRAGLTNISIDLIYGWPDQTGAEWETDLDRAISFGLPHLSLYPLTVETGTPLAAMVRAGRVVVADDDRLTTFYDQAVERLAAAGYRHYEVANWALAAADQPSLGPGSVPPLASQHNLLYWRNQEYWGGGPGAHSHWSGRRWSNLRSPRHYLTRVAAGEGLVAQSEEIDTRLAMAETMFLGLRLTEGVSAMAFAERHGQSLAAVFGRQLQSLEARGLLIWLGDSLIIPPVHRYQLDGIVADFLPE